MSFPKAPLLSLARTRIPTETHRVMERMPDTEMGAPGPLVHALERMSGRYENELVESIKRKPTPLAIWMVNGILNGTRSREQRQYYMDLLRFAVDHPAATES